MFNLQSTKFFIMDMHNISFETTKRLHTPKWSWKGMENMMHIYLNFLSSIQGQWIQWLIIFTNVSHCKHLLQPILFWSNIFQVPRRLGKMIIQKVYNLKTLYTFKKFNISMLPLFCLCFKYGLQIRFWNKMYIL